MRQWLGSLLLLVMVLTAGCTAPSSPPAGPRSVEPMPPPAESPGGPRVMARSYYRETTAVKSWEPGITDVKLLPGHEEAVVGSGAVTFIWRLDQTVEGAEEKIRFDGHAPDQVSAEQAYVQAHFPAGGPERWTIWLEGVKDSRTTLVRKPEPTVQVSYRHGGGDTVPANGSDLTLDPGTLTLVFRFDQEIDHGSFNRWWAQVSEQNRIEIRTVHLTWESPQRLIWELKRVPSKLELEFAGLQAEGTLLPVSTPPLVIRSAEVTPYMERIDLVKGRSERLLDLVPEVSEALLSPDGRYLLLRSWERQGESWWPERLDLADLTEKRVTRLPHQSEEVHWSGALLVSQAPWRDSPVWQVYDPGSESLVTRHEGVLNAFTFRPDGGLGAMIVLNEEVRTGTADFETVRWNQLVLINPHTGERQTVPQFVRAWYFGKGGDFSQWVAWSPDGNRVVALDPVERNGRTDLVVFDVVKQERQVVREKVNVGPWGYRLAWSPDGGKILATANGHPTTIIPLDGGPVVSIPETYHLGAYWDGTGERILAARGDWEGVLIYDLGTGTSIDLGDGWPVGWEGESVYLIRWGGSDARHVEVGP